MLKKRPVPEVFFLNRRCLLEVLSLKVFNALTSDV